MTKYHGRRTGFRNAAINPFMEKSSSSSNSAFLSFAVFGKKNVSIKANPPTMAVAINILEKCDLKTIYPPITGLSTYPAPLIAL